VLTAQKKQEAENVAPLMDENKEPTQLKRDLEELDVTTLLEVEVALEEAESKANSIDANPDGEFCFRMLAIITCLGFLETNVRFLTLRYYPVIRQYEQRKKEIAELETKLDDLKSDNSAQMGVLNDKCKRWKNELEKVLVKINCHFTKYMEDMKCTGEVVLSKGGGDTEGDAGDDDDIPLGDFTQWGIEIRVSFRENHEKQVLSAHRQSGGERSVSTIMYLMALQGLMVAPFRCVGKIRRSIEIAWVPYTGVFVLTAFLTYLISLFIARRRDQPRPGRAERTTRVPPYCAKLLQSS